MPPDAICHVADAAMEITPAVTKANPRKKVRMDDDADDGEGSWPAQLLSAEEALGRIIRSHEETSRDVTEGRDMYTDMDDAERERMARLFDNAGLSDVWRAVSNVNQRKDRMMIASQILRHIGPVWAFAPLRRANETRLALSGADFDLVVRALSEARAKLEAAVPALSELDKDPFMRGIAGQLSRAAANLAALAADAADLSEGDKARFVAQYAVMDSKNAHGDILERFAWARGVARAYVAVDIHIENIQAADGDADAEQEILAEIRPDAAPLFAFVRAKEHENIEDDDDDDDEEKPTARRARAAAKAQRSRKAAVDDTAIPIVIPRRSTLPAPARLRLRPATYEEIAAQMRAYMVGATASVLGPYVAAAVTNRDAIKRMWAEAREPSVAGSAAGSAAMADGPELARRQEELQNFDVTKTLQLLAINMQTELGAKAGETPSAMWQWVHAQAMAAARGGTFELEAKAQVERMQATAADILDVPESDIEGDGFGAHEWIKNRVAAHVVSEAQREQAAGKLQADAEDADLMMEDADDDVRARAGRLAEGLLRRVGRADVASDMWDDARGVLFDARNEGSKLALQMVRRHNAERADVVATAEAHIARARAAQEVAVGDFDTPQDALRAVAWVRDQVAQRSPNDLAGFADLVAQAKRPEFVDNGYDAVLARVVDKYKGAEWAPVLDAAVNDLDALRLSTEIRAKSQLSAPEEAFLMFSA